MRIRRGLLFAGLFLIPVGAMTLLVRAGTIDADAFTDIWRFWPLILIGFGIAILLGRSRVAAVGTAIAAVVLGVLVGGAIASGGDRGSGTSASAGRRPPMRSGSTRPARSRRRSTIDLDLRCGSVTLTDRAGDGLAARGRVRGYCADRQRVAEQPRGADARGVRRPAQRLDDHGADRRALRACGSGPMPRPRPVALAGARPRRPSMSMRTPATS